jgi:hypothetical protein
MSAVADSAAEAAAIALVNGRDPVQAARAAAPGWARDRIDVQKERGHVRVMLRAPAVLRVLRGPVRAQAEASVRPPRE